MSDPQLATFLEKSGAKTVTYRALSKVLGVTQDALLNIMKTQQQRIAELEQRIEAIASRPQLKWAGTFVPGAAYPECSIATRSGALWCAMRATKATPGDASGDWKLIAKGHHG